MKLVDASEFEVSKRTVASTKLSEGDVIVSIEVLNPDAQSCMSEAESNMMLSGGFGEDMDIFSERNTDFDIVQDAGEILTLEEHLAELSINSIVTLQTEKGYLLRFPVMEVPEKKKSAIGVRGIKLIKDDMIVRVYVTDAGDNPEIEVNKTKIWLRDIKIKKRDQAGQKIK